MALFTVLTPPYMPLQSLVRRALFCPLEGSDNEAQGENAISLGHLVSEQLRGKS